MTILSTMKRANYLILFIIIAATFAITGFNFEDFSLKENKEEYILFLMAAVLGVIYLINRAALSEK